MTQSSSESIHLNCPNCAAPMHRHRFDSLDVAALEVDTCHACHAIWFDAHESARLSPDGVVDLFRFIHSQGSATAARISTKMSCARCRSPLEQTSDIARNNRFSYFRCPKGHGRLTTFLHFLREKQFVRDLTLAERQKLAAHVRQIKCTSCNGAIDIAQHAACTYCGSAVSVLDKDATQKALDHYLKERQRQGQPVPVGTSAPMGGKHGADLGYLMFDVGTDIVWAFARIASQPRSAFAALPTGAQALSGAVTEATTLPSLNDALAQSGLADSLSLVDATPGGSGIGEALTGDLGTGLAESAGALGEGTLDAASDIAADGGLVDLVTDGIGSIVEGLFSA